MSQIAEGFRIECQQMAFCDIDPRLFQRFKREINEQSVPGITPAKSMQY